MSDSIQVHRFKILEKHKKRGIKFLSTKLLTKTINEDKNVLFSDFKQGSIGNCSLIAAFAVLSKRPEFLTEILPKIISGDNYSVNMYCKGKPIKVVINDSLPVYENNNNEYSLVYAQGNRKENVFLASLLEKAFVKQACCYSYKRSIGTRALFAFTCFSPCMVSYVEFSKKETKADLMQCLEFIDESSIVLGVTPALEDDPEDEIVGHSYAVLDYNLEHKAIKLYDPRCNPKLCVSNKNLLRQSLTRNATKKELLLNRSVSKLHVSIEKFLLSLTQNTDASKGELWITTDQLENRRIQISSLHSKKMYKSDFFRKLYPDLSGFNRNEFISIDTCKVYVKETSRFMINIFVYSHLLRNFQLIVTTDKKESIKLPRETTSRQGEVNLEYFQRFTLRPNTYVFSLKFKPSNHGLNEEKEKFKIVQKISSVTKCTFEKLPLKAKVETVEVKKPLDDVTKESYCTIS